MLNERSNQMDWRETYVWFTLKWQPLSPAHGTWHMNVSILVHVIIEMMETSLSRNFMAKLLVFYIKTNEMSTERTTTKCDDLKFNKFLIAAAP